MGHYLEAEGNDFTHVVRELFPGHGLNLAARRRLGSGGMNRLLVERAQTACQRQLWAV